MFLDPGKAEGNAATRSSDAAVGTKFKSTLDTTEHVPHVTVDALTNQFTGTDATATDDVLLFTIANAQFYRHFSFQAVAGAADVEVSLDGTSWTPAVPLKNTAVAALAADEVNVAGAATRVGQLAGVYAGVRVRKKGITNPTTVLAIAGR